MEKVTYHPEAGREVEFDVLSQNSDGTVNIGLSQGENGKPQVVVSKCRVTAEITVGAATAITAEEPAKKAK